MKIFNLAYPKEIKKLVTEYRDEKKIIKEYNQTFRNIFLLSLSKLRVTETGMSIFVIIIRPKLIRMLYIIFKPNKTRSQLYLFIYKRYLVSFISCERAMKKL